MLAHYYTDIMQYTSHDADANSSKIFGVLKSMIVLFALMLVPGHSGAHDGNLSKSGSLPEESGLQPFYLRFISGSISAGLEDVHVHGGSVIDRFHRINTIAALLPSTAIEKISSRPGVVGIEPIPTYRIMSQVIPWNVDQLQANASWQPLNFEDPDRPLPTICIIDSGLFAAHDDFQGVMIEGISQIEGEDWFEDGNGHGTHVAGTIAAVGNDVGVVGVLPDAVRLFVVKAFSNEGQWVLGQSNLISATSACRDAGANVINMSLGSDEASEAEQAHFRDLYENDNILIIAAAGNNGQPDRSYPASYTSVISVAALDQNMRAASFSQYPETELDPADQPADMSWDVVETAAGGVGVLSTLPAPSRTVPRFQVISDQVIDGAHIRQSALGEVSALLADGGLCQSGSGNANWSGTIVLCERGEVTFAEKVNEVKASGGIAAVIYNHEVPGGFSGSCAGTCDQPSIPAIGISREQGLDLLTDNTGQAVNVVADAGSNCTDCTGGYGGLSGTSMAAPAVAASAALMWQACGGPDQVENWKIRQFLRATATDLSGTRTNSFEYGEGYDPVTGWGIPQLFNALLQPATELLHLCPEHPGATTPLFSDGFESAGMTITLSYE